MPEPFIVGPARPLPDDPVESFKSMDREIGETVASEPIGAPVLPCKEPFVEIWLFDNQPGAVPLADCEVSLPTGKSRSGKLDPDGYLKIENFDVDDPDLENTMALGILHPDGKIELKLTRDAPVEEEKDEDEKDIPEPPPLYVKPPFDEPGEPER